MPVASLIMTRSRLALLTPGPSVEMGLSSSSLLDSCLVTPAPTLLMGTCMVNT